MRFERINDTVHDPVLLILRDMLKHIERKNAVIATRQPLLANIANDGFEEPGLLHACLCILDVNGIEVGDRQLLDGLEYDRGTERVPAADLENTSPAIKHFCYK